ncbi:hypothetical protein CWS43_17135 [Rahnella sp. AA]|nr:hypothetical protein CWS43_17135 [Rahnella sp. AA]
MTLNASMNYLYQHLYNFIKIHFSERHAKAIKNNAAKKTILLKNNAVASEKAFSIENKHTNTLNLCVSFRE